MFRLTITSVTAFRRIFLTTRAFLWALGVACVLAAGVSPCGAQDIPNIEKEDTPATQPTRRGTRTPFRPRGGTSVPRVNLVDVVIITEQPGMKVSLNGRVLPNSNANRRINAKLAPKTYTVVTSGTDQPTKSFTITVTPARTMFNLAQIPPIGNQPVATISSNSNNTPSTNNTAAATKADAAPIPASAPPLNALANPEEVVSRYLNPQLSTTITESDWQQVEQVTSEALQTVQSNPKLHGLKLFAQGQIAYLRKDHATAAVLFNNAKLVVPDSALVHYGLGNNLLTTNQAKAAFDAYQRAVTLNPKLALGYKGMGDAATKLGRTKDAFANYNRARELGYASPSLSLEIARDHVRERRWQQAIDTLTPLAQVQPTDETYVLLGDSYVGLKQPYSAMQAYLRATQLNGKSAASFFKYGAMMFDLREYSATVEAMERALALDTAGRNINRERAREYVEKSNKALQKMRGQNESSGPLQILRALKP